MRDRGSVSFWPETVTGFMATRPIGTPHLGGGAARVAPDFLVQIF